jgi:hypothetical protein
VLVDGDTGVPITYERHVVRAGPMASERMHQRLADFARRRATTRAA